MSQPALPRPGPRDWIGAAEYPWPAFHSLPEGASVVGCYCVMNAQASRTRQEKPYLRLQLCDRHGVLEARVWDDADRAAPLAQPGSFIGVRGRVEVFNGGRQLKIEELTPLCVDRTELELFIPRSPRDAHEMERELVGVIASVEDPPYRALLGELLGPDTETGRLFRQAPAAKLHHHAYVGGLLEHTLSLAALCDGLARHYGLLVDRDLLIAGALLHDIGKIREIRVEAGFPYTDEGKLLGHILLGLELVSEAAARVPELSEQRRLLLLHLIASHQGKYEWQSPREPRTLEGLLLHFGDDLDAKMHQAAALVGAVRGGWTPYDRAFAREFFRHFPPHAGTERGPAETGGGPSAGPAPASLEPDEKMPGSGEPGARRSSWDLFADQGVPPSD